MSYKRIHGFFSAYQKQECFWQAWIADPSFCRNLVISHGLGEHSSNYYHILNYFEGANVNIFAYDMRGHGKSKGERGKALGIFELSYDLEAYLAMLRNEFQIKKPILCGHSLGALVALNFALEHSNQWNLEALVINATSFRGVLTIVQRIKAAFAKTLHFLLQSKAKGLIFDRGTPVQQLTHDEEVIKHRLNDPLAHDKVSLSLALDILETGPKVLTKASQLQIPVLVSHGQEDALTDPQASVEFYEQVASQEKHLHIYPDMYHETYNEVAEQRQQALKDLKKFVLAHMPSS